MKTTSTIAGICSFLLLTLGGVHQVMAAGSLAGTSAAPPSTVNLTNEGTADWGRWGLTTASSFDRRAAVTPQITNITPLGAAAQRFPGNAAVWSTHSWSGGTPTATSAASPAGIFFNGVGSGYQFTVPADGTQRTLRLYLGGFQSQSRIEATLSDGSAAPYIATIDSPTGALPRVVTLTFSAASGGQTLTVRHTLIIDYGSGNLALQAATLQQAVAPPTGGLAGTMAAPPSTVNLTNEGTADWGRWGLTTASSFDRRAAVTPQITNITPLGAAAQRFPGNAAVWSTHSWSGGTPTATSAASPAGIFFNGVGSGYQFTVPADGTQRTLRLYLGGFQSQSRIEATLSDGSAAAYIATIDSPSGALPRVVTLTFNAASSGQTLTVRHSLLVDHGSGNLALQAATLQQASAPPPNQPPVLAPIGNKAVTAGQLLSFAVTASDPNPGDPLALNTSSLPSGAGFVDNGNGTGSFTWTPAAGAAAASPYSVTFTVTDGPGASAQETISIAVSAPPPSSGGLTGAVAAPPTSVNLTNEGTADWGRWGLGTASSFDRRAAVTPQISNITPLSTAAQRFPGNAAVWPTHSWSGGTPTATSAGTPAGIFFTGVGSGYQLTVPADGTPRTLRLYLGGFQSQSRIEATLSDGSAAAYIATIDSPSGALPRVVTLTFNAASSGQTLTVRHSLLVDHGSGNLALQAATLVQNSSPPMALPFAADFNSGQASGWIVVDQTDKASNWVVTNGEFHQTNRVESVQAFDQTYHLGTYAYLQAGLSLTNYRFSVDSTYLSGVFAEDIGVMFRYSGPGNYYRFTMNSRHGFSRLEKKVNGVFTPLAVNSRGYTVGQAMQIAVDVQGNVIQVFVDGEPLFAVVDGSLSSGTVALYAQDQSKFDNVQIAATGSTPSLTLAQPAAHTVNTTGVLDILAIATGVPSGGSVDFVLDGANLVTDNNPPYATQYPGLIAGDHAVEAILRNASNQEIARDTNTVIGTHGEYVVAFGDSITNGSGDNFSSDNTSQSGRVLAAQGFQANLTDLLDASLQRPVIVYNEGIGGDESFDTAFTRAASILARHPGSNKALVLLGTNDTVAGIPSGLGCSGVACNGTFKGNMQALINTLTGAGKTVYVARTPPVFGLSTPFANPATNVANTRVQAYNSVIVNELSGRQLGPDFYGYFLGSANRFSLFADVLHPNALGHAVIAHLWHNVLNPGAPVALPLVLDSMTRTTAAPYLKQNLLEIGDIYYVDQSYTLTSIPAALAAGVWIMTANADVNGAAADYVSFTVDRPVRVYIAYDAGASARPGWMSTYTDTGLEVGTTDPLSPTLRLYSRTFGAGPITLGGNLAAGASGANSHYTVIIVPD